MASACSPLNSHGLFQSTCRPYGCQCPSHIRETSRDRGWYGLSVPDPSFVNLTLLQTSFTTKRSVERPYGCYCPSHIGECQRSWKRSGLSTTELSFTNPARSPCLEWPDTKRRGDNRNGGWTTFSNDGSRHTRMLECLEAATPLPQSQKHHEAVVTAG